MEQYYNDGPFPDVYRTYILTHKGMFSISVCSCKDSVKKIQTGPVNPSDVSPECPVYAKPNP